MSAAASRSDRGGAAISFVVAADRWQTLNPLVHALGRLESPWLVELVVVLEDDAGGERQMAKLAGLAEVRVLVVESVGPLPEARAIGVRASSAPIVAIGETHCFPEPHWAVAALAAHERGLGIVGPRLENANPKTARSWASLILDFGPHVAIDRPRSGEVAGHNPSYRRELLTGFGPRLGERLAFQAGICRDRPPGIRAGDEPSVAMRHWNTSSFSGFARNRFEGGRTVALARRVHWSRGRRLVHALGLGVGFALILGRRLPDLKRIRRSRPVPAGTVPLMVLGSALFAVGESVGYLVGHGLESPWKLYAELHKADALYCSRDIADRAALEA